MKKRLNRF